MKSTILLLVALSGCGMNTPAGKVATFTATDLTNAIAIDRAQGNIEKLPCDQFLLSQVNTIQSAAAATIPVTGIFSATSAVDSAGTNILTAMGPAGQQAFEMACGPFILHLTGTVTGFKALLAAAPGVAQAVGIK
jgi:hypothetical protein